MKAFLKCFIAIFVVTILLGFQPANAHGVIYETKPIEDNKIRITLKWSSPSEEKGILISFYYLENGKTLKIGYELNDSAPKTASIDYSLASALPPIRIILSRVGEPDSLPFADINGIEAEEYIRHLHDAGIVNGRSGNNFEPDAQLTRAEFMVLMVKALKLEGNAADNGKFKDIKNHWAKNTLLLAYQNSLIAGYGDGTIRPDNPITLAEVSTVISRSFDFKTTRNGIYSKLKQNEWYSNFVKKMFDVGVITTKDSIYEKFNEKANISRSNCAMMISRALSTY